MKSLRILTILSLILVPGFLNAGQTYEPTEESLSRHVAIPEWMQDAKMGIYFHWGVYSVPAYGDEWYPRRMHEKGGDFYQHHIETYGDPADFGYHNFVPFFKAEHFDPVEWADLFLDAGAKFAGPVAEHHDGFSMWDSDVTPWNAMDMGPKRDVLGELYKEFEKRGMKTIATFHHARNLQRYRETWKEEASKAKGFSKSHYQFLPGWPATSDDPKLKYLYGNIPEEQWLEEVWLGKLKEVINNYQPDVLWFDSWMDMIPLETRYEFAAYYLNAAEKWNKDVIIARKQEDMPLSFTMKDHEKSREPKALPQTWMTDDTISTGSWCYTEDLVIKPLSKVVHALIDTVSKNGVMLLNISPMADGTIPADQKNSLIGLGRWLKVYGEAIYGTRPWINAAEGPTAEPSGGFKDHQKFLSLEYTPKDIRYTATKDGKTVYAFTMGAPDVGEEILLTTFADQNVKVKSVSLLSGGDMKWSMTTKGLEITLLEPADDPMAAVFEINLK
jgi:alpha-L-fucosidase